MRIGFDAKRAFHNARGLGNYSRDLIAVLNNFYPDNRYFLFNPSTKNNIEYSYPANTEEINPTRFIDKLFPSLWRTKGFVKEINRLDIDLYHGLSQELPIGIEKTGVKKVVTMHDAIFMRYPELYSSSYRKIFIQKNIYACKVADRIIAISEQTKSDFIRYFNIKETKIDVVYQGCNAIFREKISAEKKQSILEKYQLPDEYILNVGAIEKRKNAGLIIEALHRAKIEIPLLILGKPTKYMAELRQLIEKYEMNNQVKFIHNALTDDLPAIYAAAKIFVNPSIFEGFGIPILEAICTGTPVIASKGTCFEETGGADSIYIDPENSEDLAEAIQKVLNDEKLQEKMKESGLLHAANFSDEKIAQNIMKIYLK